MPGAEQNTEVALAGRGVRSSVVRLPPTVHSALDHHGFVPTLIASAREKGTADYVGDGSNRWPAGHTLDAARLYRLALEAAPAGHGCTPWPTRVSRSGPSPSRSGGTSACGPPASRPRRRPTTSRFLAGFAALDNPTSSAQTRALLGWEPTGPGLLEDLDAGHYFAAPAAAVQ